MTFLKGKHPFISLQIYLPKKEWKRLKCLIDTGFSGGIAVPGDYRAHFDPSLMIEAHFLLADGTGLTTDTTFTSVRYNGETKEVPVVFLGEKDSLVGVEFLDAMRFCLDLKKRRVELS